VPLGLERLVQADLLGDHRLDLDHLVDVVRLRDVGDDPVGLVGVDLLRILQLADGAGERAAKGGLERRVRDCVLSTPLARYRASERRR
jgi:hypothetical protein